MEPNLAKAAVDVASLRFERKFHIAELEVHEIRSLVRLHPAMFSPIYQPRSVNNLYLDTMDMRNYFDNVEGLAERTKTRIRWYGELFGTVERPVLELKRRWGLLGDKLAWPMNPIMVGRSLDLDRVQEWFQQGGFPELVTTSLRNLRPTLLNCYRRSYYLSADTKVRLTLDELLEFYDVRVRGNSWTDHRGPSRYSVVELKFLQDYEKHASEIASAFPFRMTRNSKYVTGMDLFDPW